MILVFGKNGQVAQSLAKTLPKTSLEVQFFSSAESPFTDAQKILNLLNEHKPKIVINAAAYTAVDKAETERELSMEINAATPGLIAQWCAQNEAILIHYSTDYVFDGSGEKPWVEADTPDPVNWYGHTKLEGEKKIQASGCDFYIFRISWVYCEWGANFRNTIRRLACERQEIKIVNDQWGSPTHAMDVAQTTTQLTQQILQKKPRLQPGIYHLRFAPYMTWYDFALKIIQEARDEGLPVVVSSVIGIPSENYPTPAKRPKNSRMNSIHSALQHNS